MFDQKSHRGGVAGCPHQCCLAESLLANVHIRMVVKKHFHDLDLTQARRCHQRGLAAFASDAVPGPPWHGPRGFRLSSTIPVEMTDKRSQPGAFGRVILAATRVWVPVVIAVAGVLGIVIGHGKSSAAGAGVGLVIVALIVWMINWMYRLSIESNRERDREEAAREYFDRHGRWPDE